jgi:hypothetical protein
MMFKGYIDESYDQKMFTLSCLMSDIKGWSELEASWNKCLLAKNKELRKAGRCELSRYHAADCSSRVGEFKGWSTEEQIAFTKDLLRCAKSTFLNVIAYSMPMADFLEEFPDSRSDPEGNCYTVLLWYLMIEMSDQILMGEAKHAREGRRSKQVSIVLFHDRSKYDKVLLDTFNKAMADPIFRGQKYFSTITSLSWEDSIPLQVADLMAYENFKESSRQLTGRNRRKTLESLLGSQLFGGRCRTFKSEGVKELRETLEKAKLSITTSLH